ncbi:MAG TPA: glycosyltransferase family 39 protein [Polyangia bacterium]|nr:glycosyltransferase family 39 protein [Polyangia bacterium]
MPDPSSVDPGSSAHLPAAGPSLRRELRENAPLYLVLGVLLLLGLFLRFHDMPGGTGLKFDEHHYVRVARSNVAHRYDTALHPALGSLIMAGAIELFGDGPFAWRLPALVFGLCTVVLCAWVTRVVFKSWRAALMAGAFIASDGFFIGYSRVALIDTTLIAFGIAGIAVILTARNGWGVLLAGLLLGASASVKLSGVPFIAAAAAVCLARRRLRWYVPLVPLAAALVFYAQTAFHLMLTGGSGSLSAAIAEHRRLLHSHFSFTGVNPLSSKWYTWFVPARPFFLWRDVEAVGGNVHALHMLGNPLLWWGSSVAVILCAIFLARVGWRRVWRQLQDGAPPSVEADAPAPPAGPARPGLLAGLEPRAGALFWVFLTWAGSLGFWVLSLREAYLYHFLPIYMFALIMLAGVWDRWYARRPLAALIGLCAVLEVALLYAPMWGELPITEAALNARLFPFWR